MSKNKENILNFELINELLLYDEYSGKLYWKNRPPELFKGSKRGKVGDANHWNKLYGEKECFMSSTKTGYLYGHIFDIKYYKHRIAWFLHYGEWPKYHIDHINGDRKDNRIINLRDTTPYINMRNTKLSARNKTGFVGVSENRGKYEVFVLGKYKGIYEKLEEAIEIRKKCQEGLGFSERHGEVRNNVR